VEISTVGFSVHATRHDTSIIQHDLPWDDLVMAVFSDLPIIPNKDDCPCIIPAQWKPGAEGKRAENVEAVTCLVLDIDEGLTEDRFDALRRKLYDGGHQFFLHYTYSCHASYLKNATYKVRVFIPLSEPIHALAWGKFWEKAAAYFGAWTIDPACRNPNRLYYLPAAPNVAAFDWMMERAWCFTQPGTCPPLDVDVIRQVGTPPKAPAPPIKLPLEAITKALAREATKAKGDVGPALRSLLDGLSYSREGGRHDTMIKLTWFVASVFPYQDPALLAQVFERSQEEMRYIHGDSPDDLAAIAEAIHSAQVKVREGLAELDVKRSDRTSFYMRQAAGVDDPAHRYTDEDKKEIARKLGVDVSELPNYWIMIAPSGRDIFMLGKNGMCEFTYTPENFAANVGYLGAAGITLHVQRGSEKSPRFELRSLRDLASDHAATLAGVKYDNRIDNHAIDNGVLSIPCPKNPKLVPTHHEHVDGFLRSLFGNQYDKAQNWLEWFPDTRRLMCALFLTGEPGIGKTLMASGLGKIWKHGSPVDFEKAMGRFNMDITKTPFIFSDEGLPNEKQVSVHLRRLIGSFDFHVEKKLGGIYESVGARRVVVASNNLRSLSFHLDNLEKTDMEAINERIWNVEGSPFARGYLRGIPLETRHAMAQYQIAEHVLHLAQNPNKVQSGTRFVVTGSQELTSSLVLSDKYSQQIFTIVKEVMEKATRNNHDHAVAIRWGAGRLFVGSNCITAYLKNTQAREDTAWYAPGTHLKKVAVSDKRTKCRIRGNAFSVYEIDTSLYYEFLEKYAGDDVGPFKAMIDGAGNT
jgi:hypothetical protein